MSRHVASCPFMPLHVPACPFSSLHVALCPFGLLHIPFMSLPCLFIFLHVPSCRFRSLRVPPCPSRPVTHAATGTPHHHSRRTRITCDTCGDWRKARRNTIIKQAGFFLRPNFVWLRALLSDWSAGVLSAIKLQQHASAAVADGLVHPTIRHFRT